MKKILLLFQIVIILFSFSSCKAKIPETADDEKFSGIWVATTSNLDFPSKSGLSGEQIKKEMYDICSLCKSNGISHILLQVRANADAIYPNSIFGDSAAIYGQRTACYDIGYDVLRKFLEIAHNNDIRLYAWINPYRIGQGKKEDVLKSLPKSHPAVQTPEIVLQSASGVLMDPGVPMTTAYIVQGIREIVENYDVDGIVFDDYFYPYEGGYDDDRTYKKYGANFQNIEDFRRYSVNHMVACCSEYLREQNMIFGISPFGIWSNASDNAEGSDTGGLSAYSEIFSDSKLWVEKGWLDFIAPQIYWSTENDKASFTKLLNWWSIICRDEKTKLYVAHYVSRIGSEQVGWEDEKQLDLQLKLCFNDPVYDGSIFFHYSDFKNNQYNECQTVAKYYK